MKLVDLTCPSCGGKMQVNPELETVSCNFCGNQMILDKEIVEQKITGGYDFGYEQEQGRIQAQQEEEERKRLEEERKQKIIKFNKVQNNISTVTLLEFALCFCFFEILFMINFVNHYKPDNYFRTIFSYIVILLALAKDGIIIWGQYKKKCFRYIYILGGVQLLAAFILSVSWTKNIIGAIVFGFFISISTLILLAFFLYLEKIAKNNEIEDYEIVADETYKKKRKSYKYAFVGVIVLATILAIIINKNNSRPSYSVPAESAVQNEDNNQKSEDFWADENLMVYTLYDVPDMSFYISSYFMEYEDGFCAVPDDDYVSVIYYVTSDGGNFEAKKDGFIEALFPSTETEYSRTTKSKIKVSIYDAEQQIFEDDNGNKAIITMVNHDLDDKMVTILMVIDHDEYLENDYEAAYNFMIENVRYNDEETQAEIFNETEEIGEEIDVTDNVSEQQPTSNVPEGVNPDLVAFLDAYEDFMDQYISFMYYYMNNPGEAMSLMYQYMQLLEMYDAYAEAIDKYNDTEMSDADVAYYTEVLLRIDAKLMSIY